MSELRIQTSQECGLLSLLWKQALAGRLWGRNTFLADAFPGCVPPKRVLVALGFVLFLCFYASQANFPGRHYRGYVLVGGLAGSLTMALILRWKPEEMLVSGLLFAVPMVEQIFRPILPARWLGDLVLYVGLPLVFLWLVVGRLHPADVGLSLGERSITFRITPCLLAVAALLAIVGLAVPSMTLYYPIWRSSSPITWRDFAYHETLIAIMMFSCELFFRGTVLFVLGRRSFWGSILIQSVPYAYLHMGKPSVEVPYSLIAGVVFGWANLRSRSVLPSWATHFFGSALFDALIVLS